MSAIVCSVFAPITVVLVGITVSVRVENWHHDPVNVIGPALKRAVGELFDHPKAKGRTDPLSFAGM